MENYDFKVSAPTELKDIEDFCKEVLALKLKISHVKFYFDQQEVETLTWRGFIKVCPKLNVIDGEKTTKEQDDYIRACGPNYYMLLGALNRVATRSAKLDPVNGAEIMCMMNQVETVKVDLILGPVPTFRPIESKKKDFTMRICRGYSELTPEFCVALEDITNRTVSPIEPWNINFTVGVAYTQEYDQHGMMRPSAVFPKDIDGGKFFDNGMLGTRLTRIAADMFKDNKDLNGPANIMNMIFRNSKQIFPQLVKLPPDACGPDLKMLQGDVLSIANKKFQDMTYGQLYAYERKIWSCVGKRKGYLKRIDCGSKALNVAIKFSPVLSLVSGSPFVREGKGAPVIKNPDFKPTLSLCYFGAGGQRGRQVFDNRFNVDAFDLADPPQFSTKKMENDFKNDKYKTWVKKDIYGFNDYAKYDVFVSDIFMQKWNSKNDVDHFGHKFVSNILKGFVKNDAVVIADAMPKIRVVKGFVPDMESMCHYDGDYPFIVADTSRACTTELIYMKFHKISKGMFAGLDAAYGCEVSKRFHYVENQIQFEAICRAKLVSAIQEVLCQLRSLALSFKINFASPRNRYWWVASDDLPRLFVPRKFGLEPHHGMSLVSDVFQSIFGMFGETDDEGLPKDLIHISKEKADLSDVGEVQFSQIDFDKEDV